MSPGRPQRKKTLAVALALLATVGLAFAAFGKRWLASSDGEDGMGLREVEACTPECEVTSLERVVEEIHAEIKRRIELNKTLQAREQMPLPRAPWAGWTTVGLLTFLALLLAAAGLVAGAALAVLGKRPVLPVMPTTLAVLGLLIAIVCGCLFIATKPEDTAGMAAGWSFLAFGGSAVLGLAAVFPLNRAIRPIDEELGEGASTMSWSVSRDDE